MAQRAYWPELLNVIREACDYYNKYQAKLPDDLRASLAVPLSTLNAACLILQLYDIAHARGQGTN